MRKLVYLTVIGCIQFVSAQGIKFDKARYNKIPVYEVEKSQGFANLAMAPKISYRQYCPQVFKQHESTCVGWAVYSLLSTQQNILMNETNPQRKLFRAMDPYFVYSLIRNKEDKWCEEGTFPQDAFDVLKDYGTKPLFANPDIKCNSNLAISNQDNLLNTILNAYTISEYHSVYSDFMSDSDKIAYLKNALKAKKPILIGLPTSDKLGGTDNSIWMYDSNGGHAMCIIGYDDSKLGGCFELMNSWGSDWGDGGFAWIRYEDIMQYLEEAYVVELNTSDTGFRQGNCTLGDCRSSYSRYVYDNGDVYEGEFKNGIRNGWGMLIDKDYCEYVGTFENGYKHGWGVTYTPLTGIYSKTFFNYGQPELAANKQGFSGSQDDKKLDEVLQLMQAKRAGKILDPKSDEYQDFIKSIKPEEEPQEVKQ
jgi:hypothetical protein